jgi:hypothetical protein
VSAVGFTLSAQEAGAQGAAVQREVTVGARVRVFAPDMRSDRYVGRVDSMDVAVLVLDTAGVRTRLGFDLGPVLVDEFRRVTIRRTAIQVIEVSGGRTTRGSTVRGLVLGSLIGGLLFGLGTLPERNPTFSDFVRGVPPGLAVGAVVGGVVGWTLGGERWLPAAIPR